MSRFGIASGIHRIVLVYRCGAARGIRDGKFAVSRRQAGAGDDSGTGGAGDSGGTGDTTMGGVGDGTPKKTPGFEILGLIAAIGIATVLVRRRR